jgi:hypothetical protein
MQILNRNAVKKQTNKAPEPEILDVEPSRPPSGKTTYSFEVTEKICQQMAEGKGLRAICSQPDMPARTTVLRWLEEQPGFRTRYQYAREALLDWYGEEILKIAFDDSGDLIVDGDRVMSGHHVVQRARLKVDTLKWIMSKLGPKKWGDRPESDADSGPITISWLESDKAPPIAPAPPKQIEYKRPELPADLSERDWSLLVSLLETVKRTIPTNSDDPPETVFAIMRDALLKHYTEDEPPKRVVLKPRGRSGKS